MDIEEIKQRIERKILIGKCNKNIGEPFYISDIEAVLSELEKKDKIIDKMAEEITDVTGSCPLDRYDFSEDCDDRCKLDLEKECWINYFTKKAEEK